MAWPESGTADRVRLGVRDGGVYRVTADEVALASGLSVSAVRQAFEMTDPLVIIRRKQTVVQPWLRLQ